MNVEQHAEQEEEEEMEMKEMGRRWQEGTLV